MKINTAHLFVIALITLSVGVMISPYILVTQVPFSTSMTETYSAPSIGSSVLVQYRLAGATEWKEIANKHNLLTNMGRNITRDCLVGAGCGASTLKIISLGNATNAGEPGTETAADVVLASESTTAACTLERASHGTGTVNYQAPNSTSGANANGNWSITNTFTNSCLALAVNSTGLYNATSGNVLFAESNFTTTTLQTNDQINITWFIWIS
jgi:hypothetical protein